MTLKFAHIFCLQ